MHLAQKCPTTDQFTRIMDDYANETMRERNIANEIVGVSQSCIFKLENDINATYCVAQLKPEATVKAERDPRNPFSIW